MRVLVIEDDRKVARQVLKGLQGEGFVVDLPATGEDGEAKAMVNRDDVIVRDWRVPGKDGLAVCRGHASRATDEAGVGLGLAIARALIERQGGRISVKPSSDRGATFALHLPRAGGEGRATEASTP